MTASSIDRLPEAERVFLADELRRRNHTGFRELEVAMQERGHSLDHVAIWRFSQRLRKTAEQVQATVEITQRLVESLGTEAVQALSQANIGMAQALVYELLTRLSERAQENEAGGDPEQIAKLLSGLAALTRADLSLRQYDDRRRADAEAKLKALEQAAAKGKRSGLGAETLKRIREEVYGITN